MRDTLGIARYTYPGYGLLSGVYRTKTVRLLCDPGVDRCACLTWRVLHSFTREQEIETKVSFPNTTVELFTVSVYCQSN